MTVEVGVAAERAARAREREHGQWDRNGHVDAHLADVDLLREFASSCLGDETSLVLLGVVFCFLLNDVVCLTPLVVKRAVPLP